MTTKQGGIHFCQNNYHLYELFCRIIFSMSTFNMKHAACSNKSIYIFLTAQSRPKFTWLGKEYLKEEMLSCNYSWQKYTGQYSTAVDACFGAIKKAVKILT